MRPLLYLSGPMSGMPDLNFPAFHRAAAKLRASGYDVVNPAEMDEADTSPKEWHEYLRRDLIEMLQRRCTHIALLPGHENSKGATLELTVAKALGMEVMHLGAEWQAISRETR